jgi:hypothetical protein
MRPCDPHHIRVDEWGVILRIEAPAAEATFVGIRAHHVQLMPENGGDNTFRCEVLQTIESPFEVTVYLRLNGATLEAEMPIATASPRDTYWVRLDAKDLLLLRE